MQESSCRGFWGNIAAIIARTFSLDVVGILIGSVGVCGADSGDLRRLGEADFITGDDSEGVVSPRRQGDLGDERRRVEICLAILPRARLKRSVVLEGKGERA